MTKIITCSKLRYLTLDELEALFRTLRSSSGARRNVCASAASCSPAAKAAAAPWRRALRGSRSHERRRLGLAQAAALRLFA